MEILKPLLRSDNDEIGSYVFWCIGCEYHHSFEVDRWNFNGDMQKPTFTPSLIVFRDTPEHRCHLFMTDGKIQYLSDSHHKLAGQTVEMVAHNW